MEPGDGALDDPTEDAQAGAVWLSPFGDHGSDAALPQQATVLVVVVAAVGKERVGASTRSPDDAGNRGNLVDQRHELGDVVAVPAGQRDRQRNPGGVGDQVVL